MEAGWSQVASANVRRMPSPHYTQNDAQEPCGTRGSEQYRQPKTRALSGRSKGNAYPVKTLRSVF